jgi:hypothetical protein
LDKPDQVEPSSSCLEPLEENTSSQQEIKTPSTGRDSFQSMKYNNLITQKGFFPVDEIFIPHQPEGIHSSQ